jgi:hypothetical protein
MEQIFSMVVERNNHGTVTVRTIQNARTVEAIAHTTEEAIALVKEGIDRLVSGITLDQLKPELVMSASTPCLFGWMEPKTVALYNGTKVKIITPPNKKGRLGWMVGVLTLEDANGSPRSVPCSGLSPLPMPAAVATRPAQDDAYTADPDTESDETLS